MLDGVDLKKYPLFEPETEAYCRAVEAVRQGLATEACARLPGFIDASRLTAYQKEAAALEPLAVYRSHQHNPYFSSAPGDAPDWDPRRRFCGRTNGMVPAESFDRDGLIWKLYTSGAFVRFLADCLGLDELYCYADPLGCIVLSVQGSGEEFTWHFDTNEFAITLLLQEPVGGGLFEYAPKVRTPTDERYRAIADILDGRSGSTRVLQLHAGDLQIFHGRYSLHRVTEVEGSIPRLIAVMAYTTRPGVYASPERAMQAWGRVHPDQIKAQENNVRADRLTD